MTTTDNIGFKLIIAEPDVAERTVVVCPRYDNLKLKDSKPSGKMYYKKSLSGTVKFLGVDFTTIYSCALRTKYTLVVYQHSVGEIVRATFRKTDCKWDVNHQIAEVDIAAADPYKKIEDNKDNEYNLVNLDLQREGLSLKVYPQNQIYIQDDKEICLFGPWGKSSRASVADVHDMERLRGDGFAHEIVVGNVKLYGSGINYTFHKQRGDFTEDFVIDGSILPGASSILRATYIGQLPSGSAKYLYFGYFVNSTSSIVYDWYNNLSFAFLTWDGVTDGEKHLASRIYTFNSLYSANDIIIYSGTGVYDFFSCQCRIWVPCYGMATTVEESGWGIIDENDITASFNHNYKSRGDFYNHGSIERYTINNILDKVRVSTVVSNTPTPYGKVEETNLYYAPPNQTQTWEPVKKDSWAGGVSLWLTNLNVENFWVSSGLLTGEKSVADFYLLGDAIRAVIKQIDTSIEFDIGDSKFLFDEINPVSGDQQGTMYISQKSNVLKLDYDYPAWLAPITWGKIETLLKNAFNCYWDLYERDGATHLRIEHRTFYDRGGTYNDNDPRDTHNLRTVYRNSTPYSYAEKTNRWEWDKDGNGDSTACRYEYSWMDTQTEMFDGKTIEIPEEYRLFDDDKLEDRKVDWFSSDIDFLISVTSECSSDGFALVMESLTRPGWIISGNENYAGQNYELSLEYLQPRYLLAGIYSPVVKIGDTEVQNTVTARLRKAEVDFRLLQGEDVKAGDILITEVGEGLIDSLEKDLHSGKMTATVRYENE